MAEAYAVIGGLAVMLAGLGALMLDPRVGAKIGVRGVSTDAGVDELVIGTGEIVLVTGAGEPGAGETGNEERVLGVV